MNKFLLVLCFVTGIAALANAQKVPAVFTPVLKVPSGSVIDGQIIAGKPAVLGQFPWQAALSITVGSSKYVCGGTLVHRNWILTAAHCLEGASSVIVRLGSIDFRTGGTSYNVGTSGMKMHTGYNTNTLANDVAMIQIPTILNSTTISPINILPLSVTSFTGNLTVSGFGMTCDAITSTCSAGKLLNYVNVVPITNIVCLSYYGSTIYNATICTSGYNSGKESTCGGDSGGPLVQLNPKAKNYLVGVVSFGVAKCETKYPSGYTRANMFCAWMKTTSGVDICV